MTNIFPNLCVNEKSSVEPKPLPQGEQETKESEDDHKLIEDNLSQQDPSKDDVTVIGASDNIVTVESEDDIKTPETEDDLRSAIRQDDLYVYCDKVAGRCLTHQVDLVSRKVKSKVWKSGAHRRVYKLVESFVCPGFLVGAKPVTEPLGGNLTTTTTQYSSTTR